MLLKEIRYVLAIADSESVAKAAEKLYLSQPALTKYIHSLENSLNIKLFQKSGKRLCPTEYGKAYIEAARHIQEIYSGLEQEVYASDEMIRGSLRVGTGRRGAYILPNVLPSFTERFPSVRVMLYEETYDDLDSMLLRNEIDIGILKSPQTLSPDITYLPLFGEELVLVVNADHPLCEQAVSRKGCSYEWIDLHLFKDERFILYKPGHRNRTLVNKILAKYNITPNIFWDTNYIEGALHLVQKGCGVCFAPELYAQNILQLEGEHKSIRLFSIGKYVNRYRYFVAFRNDQQNTRYMREFVNMLLQFYAGSKE